MVKQVPNEKSEWLNSLIHLLIPASLDDVIRWQREDYQLRLSTLLEIFDLHKTIWPKKPKDFIDDWNLITLKFPEGNVVFLLGQVRSKACPPITSDVTGIDLKNNFLTTRSGSLYFLGRPKNGPPDLLELLLLCSTLHKWGLGEELGVPKFLLND